MSRYEPHKLVDMGHEATDRLNHLALTGITDRRSLLLAIQKELPSDVILIDASSNGDNLLLVREKSDVTAY